MPELPEVETIKKELLENIKGKKITDVKIITPKVINYSPRKFVKIIKGTAVKDIQRRAKLLIINFTNSYNLLVHLKLTGQFLYQGKISAATHIIFIFQDGSKLLYNDQRKFGYIKLLTDSELANLLAKADFGPEPLGKNFTLDAFKETLTRKKKSKIKPLLMNQKFIAGIGNVYAQEICFYAKVLPMKEVSSLSQKEIRNIYKGIKEILPRAIKYKGSSVDTYLDIYGKKGKFIPFLKVYGREGKQCLRCKKAKIKKITLAGRGTCFCPNCQR